MEQAEAQPPRQRPQPPATPKRAFTMPTSLQGRLSTSQREGAETLYAHAETKTFCFATNIRPDAVGTKQNAGTLPWSVPSERIIATGPLCLYRLRSSGNATFLCTGDTIVTLSRRTLGWCVDGASRFALFIRQNIYRIELPADTEDERALVEGLRAVLADRIHYERAPCPFKRGFEQDETEELPSPASRRRKGPSKRARKWEFKARWRPEDDPDYDPTRRPESGGSPGESEDSASDVTDGSTFEYEHESEQEHGDRDELASKGIQVQKTRPGVAAVRSMFDQPHATAPKHPMGNSSSTGNGLDTSRHVRSLSKQLEASSVTPTPISAPSKPYLSHARDDSVATVTPATFHRPQTPPSEISYSTTTPVWTQAPAGLPTPPASGSGLDKTGVQDTAQTQDISSSNPHQLVSSEEKTQTEGESSQERDISSIPDVKQEQDTSPQHDDAVFDDSIPGKAESIHDTVSSAASIETIPEDSELPPNPISADLPSAITATTGTGTNITSTSTSNITAITSAAAPPVTPKKGNIRRRRTASPRSHRRFRSQDMPSYVLDDMSSPTVPAVRSTSLAALGTSSALLAKTMALMLGPPSGLVQVMVQIAARISQTGADGAVFSVQSMTKMMRGQGRAIPGRWTSDSEDEDDRQAGRDEQEDMWAQGPNELDEDDFGVPLGVETPARTRRHEWSSGVS